jgi:DNA invertase Pin-like site-specific DNA recombinase
MARTSHTAKRGDPKIAVAYLRVSTEEQHLGPEAQRAAIERWAESSQVTVIAWHTDQGISGGSELDDRPGLMQALADLRTHRAGVLAIAKRDRLARDVEVSSVITRAIRAAGASVASADGNNNEDPASNFMRRIEDAMAEHERALISARTKAALAVKRARGERVGACPFGFRVLPSGKLIPDDGEQAVIATVHELRAAGLSERAVVAALGERGLRSRAGTAFSQTQVRRFLARAIACGRGHAHKKEGFGKLCLSGKCGEERGVESSIRRIVFREGDGLISEVQR